MRYRVSVKNSLRLTVVLALQLVFACQLAQAAPLKGGGFDGVANSATVSKASPAASSKTNVTASEATVRFPNLREFILRDKGQGEGASVDSSPINTWKGEVKINVCNFKHICQQK